MGGGWAIAGIAAVGLVGLVAFHWAEFASGFGEICGERGDTRLVGYLLEHGWQRLLGHGHWLSPAMFWPVGGTLGYADAFVLHGLGYWPLRALGLDPFAALQATILLGDALTFAAAAWLLGRVLNLAPLWTAAGAWLFAFNAAKLHQAEHLQLQPLLLLPLIAGLVLQVVRDPHLPTRQAAWRLAAAAAALDLQMLSGFYAGWFLILVGATAWLWALALPQTRPLVWRAPGLPSAGALAVLAAGAVPFAWIYLPIVRRGGMRSWQEVAAGIPPAAALLRHDGQHLLWRALPWPTDLPWEANLGTGFVVLPAAAVALIWALRQKRHSLAVALGCGLTVVALTVAWGDFMPWRAVYALLPGAGAIRAAGRALLIAMLPLAVGLAAAGHLAQRKWLVALAAVAAIEQLGGRLHFDRKVDLVRLEALAAKIPRNCDAFALVAAPGDEPPLYALQVDAMWASVLSGVPTVNGYSGQAPPGWWPLWNVRAVNYEASVRAWADGMRAGKVCMVRAE